MTALSAQLPVAALSDAISTIVLILFVIVTLLLSLVILLQEGKGGGLAGAFGGAGADAFGVKAGTVNKFTSWLGALFLGLALLHSGLATAGTQEDLDADTSVAPAETFAEDEGATPETPDGTLPPVPPADPTPAPEDNAPEDNAPEDNAPDETPPADPTPAPDDDTPDDDKDK